MSNKSSKKSFDEILDESADVDSIFKDEPMPKGSNPFIQKPSAQAEESTALLDINNDQDEYLAANRKLAALQAMFQLVSKDCSFGELVGEILRVALEHIRSEAGSFIEIDYQNQCMFFRAVNGRSSKNLLSFTFPMGKGIAGFVCENKQPMTVSTVEDSNQYLHAISDSVGFETRNLVAFPVVIRGQTFGCIELLNRYGEECFSNADQEVLTAICDAAAKIIENRLVLAELSKRLNPGSDENSDGAAA